MRSAVVRATDGGGGRGTPAPGCASQCGPIRSPFARIAASDASNIRARRSVAFRIRLPSFRVSDRGGRYDAALTVDRCCQPIYSRLLTEHLLTSDDATVTEETVGQRIRRLRLSRGLSQRAISAPGVSYAYISRIENGGGETAPQAPPAVAPPPRRRPGE